MAVIISPRSSYCPNVATAPFIFSLGLFHVQSLTEHGK